MLIIRHEPTWNSIAVIAGVISGVIYILLPILMIYMGYYKNNGHFYLFGVIPIVAIILIVLLMTFYCIYRILTNVRLLQDN